MKLNNQLNVKNIAADESKIAADKDKTEKNKRFLNSIKGDIYIDEAVKVTNKMIVQSNIALNHPTKTTQASKN